MAKPLPMRPKPLWAKGVMQSGVGRAVGSSHHRSGEAAWLLTEESHIDRHYLHVGISLPLAPLGKIAGRSDYSAFPIYAFSPYRMQSEASKVSVRRLYSCGRVTLCQAHTSRSSRICFPQGEGS